MTPIRLALAVAMNFLMASLLDSIGIFSDAPAPVVDHPHPVDVNGYRSTPPNLYQIFTRWTGPVAPISVRVLGRFFFFATDEAGDGVDDPLAQDVIDRDDEPPQHGAHGHPEGD